jgi:glycosyltransferase involved in cell wall biosynthesis
MRVFYLANRVPWFGAHTGYEHLPDFARGAGLNAHTLTSDSSLLARVLGKVHSLRKGHGQISQSDSAARWRLERSLTQNPDAIGHLLYGEEHLPYWKDAAPEARRRSVLTLHQPSTQWHEEKARSLAGCPHLIVLWQRELDWFRERAKGGSVDFVLHGADTEFFCPDPEPKKSKGPLRLLYVGVHMRNTAMLARIIGRLNKEHDLHFDFLVPNRGVNEPHLGDLAQLPNVQWHQKVDDMQLRALYRGAHLLLLPLDNSGANTAVVEALACGLPIVTTDVGGIRDYGGGNVFPVVENNDDDTMLALLENYLSNCAWRDEIAAKSRLFAEQHLAWPIVARQHAALYHKVAA